MRAFANATLERERELANATPERERERRPLRER
jgi:hypothetical protein